MITERNLKLKDIYKDYNDFILKTGIDKTNLNIKLLYDLLSMRANDTYTKWGSLSYAITNTAFIISQGAEKLDEVLKIKKKYQDNLIGMIQESKNYLAGDLATDPDNFDKYLSTRATNSTINNPYYELLNILNNDSLTEVVYRNVYNKMFSSYQLKTKRRKLW